MASADSATRTGATAAGPGGGGRSGFGDAGRLAAPWGAEPAERTGPARFRQLSGAGSDAERVRGALEDRIWNARAAGVADRDGLYGLAGNGSRPTAPFIAGRNSLAI